MTAAAPVPPYARGTVVLVLAVLMLLPSSGQTLMIPALPALAGEMGATPDAVAWTVTGYLITASVATPLLGRLGDMFGHRRMQLWVLAAFCLGSLVCALATSLEALVAGRMLQGFIGGVFSLGIALVRETRAGQRVPRDIGVLSAFVGVGTCTGLVLGGLLVDADRLAWLFWGQVGLGAAVALLVARVVPAGARPPGGRVDVPGTLLLTLAVALPLIAFSRGSGWLDELPLTLAIVGAGLVVLAGWCALERRTAAPLIDMRTLALPTVRLANAATFLVGAAMFGLYVLTPQLVQADPAAGYGFALNATEAGLVLLPGGVLILVAGPLSGSAGRRFGHHVPLAAGGALTALALLALALEHSSVAVVVVFATLASFGVGIAFPAMPNLVVGAVPRQQVGESAGFNAMLRGIGSSVGTQVTAAVLAASTIAGTATPSADGYVAALSIAAAAAAGASVIVLRVRRQAPVA